MLYNENQLIDLDVSTTVERRVEGNKEVIAKITRGANRKTVLRISEELKKKTD
mgnify:FL=1